MNTVQPSIPIFYSQNQSVPLTVEVSATSPSAHKPAMVVEEALRRYPDKLRIVDFQPLTREDIKQAHDSDYVDGVLNSLVENGFGNKLPEVAAALPWTNGSLFAAANHALYNQTMAMSPTSGFHHACYDKAMGFCTFNGLMIAVFKLWAEQITRDVKTFGIIDFDAHYGNGTQDIIEKFDVSRHWLVHETFGKYAKKQIDYEPWLDQLPDYLATKFKGCSLLFYQAGADPHIDDPYGGFLTTEQMLRRDQIVFQMAKYFKVPIVWNLAGGYQTPANKVIDLHMNTFEAAFASQF
jgi:acetoin utilization deacetylase AcuC-like enzyme